MKTIFQLFVLTLLATIPISNAFPSDTFAKISDQIVYPPEDGSNDLETLRSIIVVRVSKVDGKEPNREENTIKGNPPYVLLKEGTHKLEVAKSRLLSKPEEMEETEVFECFVNAGLIYEIKHTENGITLEERIKK